MIITYGPYQRQDGRRHVVHYDTVNRTRRTQSYPRFLMEKFLDRELLKDEHVDHINNDPTDDRLENYQLLTQLENSEKYVLTTDGAEKFEFNCPQCSKAATKPAAKVRHNRKQGKAGPYCGKSCAAKASRL